MAPAELRRIESGEVAFVDLPETILARAAADVRLDLDRLRPSS